MVETTTTQLFNTAEYNKRLDEADKQLNRTIAKRMTKLKTVVVSLVVDSVVSTFTLVLFIIFTIFDLTYCKKCIII